MHATSLENMKKALDCYVGADFFKAKRCKVDNGKVLEGTIDQESSGCNNRSALGGKERYAIEISTIGFDQSHVHILSRFLPKYSGGQVIKIIEYKRQAGI